MKYSFALFILALLLITVPVYAQEDIPPLTCNPDLSGAIASLEEAQAESDAGELENALQTLDDIQAQIDALISVCAYLTIPLPQTITVNDPYFGDTLTVNYPEGWVAQDQSGSILLADSQTSLDLALDENGNPADLGGEAIAISVSVIGPDGVEFFLDEGEEATPPSLLNATLLSVLESESEIGAIQAEIINGRNVATVIANSTAEGEQGRLFAVAMAVNDGYAIVGALTAPGEDQFDDEVRAIAASVEVMFAAEIELTQTITSDDMLGGSFTVHYPEGWFAQGENSLVTLSNSEEVLTDANRGPTMLAEDEVIVSLIAFNEDTVSSLLSANEPVTPARIVDALFVDMLPGDDDQIYFDPTQDETLNGRDAATVVATGLENGVKVRLFAIIVQVGEGYVVMIAVTPPDEEAFDATLRAIAGEVEATYGEF